ncbi:MAG: RagB/SusD family nutrient uptake outer membrane protein, partial [Deltaproteobacteria bacterium]
MADSLPAIADSFLATADSLPAMANSLFASPEILTSLPTMIIKKLLTATTVAALLGLAALGTSSCSKDFIDLNDPTRLVSTQGYTDSLSILNGVTAAYASLQDVYGKSGTNRGLWVFSEVPSDNSYTVTSGERLNEFDTFSIVSDNPRVQSQWQYTYQAIARCNIILSRAPAVRLTTATRNRYFAEVRFIRALAYFNAVRIWGDVPLVTGEITNIADAYAFGRTPAAQVYTQIEDDLTFAAANLPTTQTAANLGRATKGAAQGLLGKVLLTEKKYSDAAIQLKAVIDANTYALQATYANIFLTTNELNSEILFAVRYTKGGLGVGSGFTNFFLPSPLSTAFNTSVNGGVGTGQQFNTVDADLVAAFTASGPTDVRAAASYGNTTTPYFTKKYIDTPTTAFDGENDWIVLRYADVLLMYAEAINESTGPDALSLDAINRVIRRSRNLPVATAAPTVDLPATTTQVALRTRLETERRLELNFEG